jgi:hypothetical protein
MILWQELHDKYEKSLKDYANQFREEEDDYDDFDFFVAREKGIEIEPKMNIKQAKTTTIETKDVTDEVKSIDVTEEFKEKFGDINFRDAMLSGNHPNIHYGENFRNPYADDYDEFDDDEYDYLERDDLEEEYEEEEYVNMDDL